MKIVWTILSLLTLASCREVKIHVVVHSHMDAGWLQTVDELAVKQVPRILDSVVHELSSNSTYRYTLGDIYFFRRWY